MELMPILSQNFHCNYTREGSSNCLAKIIWFLLFFNSTSTTCIDGGISEHNTHCLNSTAAGIS